NREMRNVYPEEINQISMFIENLVAVLILDELGGPLPFSSIYKIMFALFVEEDRGIEILIRNLSLRHLSWQQNMINILHTQSDISDC
ncbi:hypothetical protein ACJX0J_036054, partial [Zea mays]